MIISEDSSTQSYRIRSYSAHTVQINDEALTDSFVICANHLIKNWGPQSVQKINFDHWQSILQLQPKLLIIGTGDQFHSLPDTLLAPLIEKNIAIECMDTQAACRTYIALTAENRNVAAAMIIESQK